MRQGISAPQNHRAGFAVLLSLCLLWPTVWAADTRLSSAPNSPPPAQQSLPATNNPLQRIVLIGASGTAGFTESEPLGGTNTDLLRLSRYLDAALVAPHEPVQSFAIALFFLRPEVLGPGEVERARQVKPTLIIGTDFLFWYCYGVVPSEEARLERFESGLNLLATVTCPLVLGDLPDASAAVNGMLSPAQMPKPATLAAANRRLSAWAAPRPNVRLIRLANFMRDSLANNEVVIQGRIWPKETTRNLIQADKLHASREGCAVIALSIMDALTTSPTLLPVESVRWDPAEVLRLAIH